MRDNEGGSEGGWEERRESEKEILRRESREREDIEGSERARE